MKPRTAVFTVLGGTGAIGVYFTQGGPLVAYRNGYIIGSRVTIPSPAGAIAAPSNDISLMIGGGGGPTLDISREAIPWIAAAGATAGGQGAYHDHRNAFPGGIPITAAADQIWAAQLHVGGTNPLTLVVHLDIWLP